MTVVVAYMQLYDILSTKTNLTRAFLLSMSQVFTFLQSTPMQAVRAGCAV